MRQVPTTDSHAPRSGRRAPSPPTRPIDGKRRPTRRKSGAPRALKKTLERRASGGAAHCAGPPLTAQGRLRRRCAIAARPLTCEPLRPLWADARAGQGLPIPARGATRGGSPGHDQQFGAKTARPECVAQSSRRPPGAAAPAPVGAPYPQRRSRADGRSGRSTDDPLPVIDQVGAERRRDQGRMVVQRDRLATKCP